MTEETACALPILKLFEQAQLSVTPLDIQLCSGGGNNRTYKIKTQQGFFAVKKYFIQSDDQRNRLASEFAFLTYAQSVTVQKTPIPYCYDEVEGLALYEFIEGRAMRAVDIHDAEIDQAIKFFTELNQQLNPTQVSLPLASEACFSLHAHLELIAARIDNLQQILPETTADKDAILLVQKLKTVWLDLVGHIKKKAAASQIDIHLPLKQSLRCISPSDFGFHNALKTSDSTLRFLDFEYAGWDDPAKMVGDFFSQLAVPIPENYFDHFVEQVMQPFEDPVFLMKRASLLRFAYQVKWCCIALNVFIPVHMARRRFANPNLNVTEMKENQLFKAEKLLKNLELCPYA